ncbi:ImmA/IrrE family metallo-endopeptidase [Mesorhizobium sp. f-mel]
MVPSGTSRGDHQERRRAYVARQLYANTSIELEADHFASGLLLPSGFTRKLLSNNQIGLDGILRLAETARCSVTAAAIRAAECSAYPVAIIVSKGDEIAYAFTSESFKNLGKLAFLRKGAPLPQSATRRFNADATKVVRAERAVDEPIWPPGSTGPAGSCSTKKSLALASTATP